LDSSENALMPASEVFVWPVPGGFVFSSRQAAALMHASFSNAAAMQREIGFVLQIRVRPVGLFQNTLTGGSQHLCFLWAGRHNGFVFSSCPPGGSAYRAAQRKENIEAEDPIAVGSR
jgi:hypothetical protein